jgi:hypothetical protein
LLLFSQIKVKENDNHGYYCFKFDVDFSDNFTSRYLAIHWIKIRAAEKNNLRRNGYNSRFVIRDWVVLIAVWFANLSYGARLLALQEN